MQKDSASSSGGMEDVTRFEGPVDHDSHHSDDLLQDDTSAMQAESGLAPTEMGAEEMEGLVGNILNAPGASADRDGATGDFAWPDETAAPLEFDGVFDVENFNVSDPAVAHQMLQDMDPAIAGAYDGLNDVAQVFDAIRELEAGMSGPDVEEPGLLRVLKRKSEVWASYMQHLCAYGLLKVDGEWFPQHRVAANLQELRAMLVELDKEEKAFGPQMVEILRQWSANATENQLRPQPALEEDGARMERPRIAAGQAQPQKAMPSLQNGESPVPLPQGRLTLGGKVLTRGAGAGADTSACRSGREGGRSDVSGEGAWRPPVAWKPGGDRHPAQTSGDVFACTCDAFAMRWWLQQTCIL